MINTQKQYETTQDWLGRFKNTLALLNKEHDGYNKDYHVLLMMKAKKDALCSQIDSLKDEIKDYEIRNYV